MPKNIKANTIHTHIQTTSETPHLHFKHFYNLAFRSS